MFAPLVAKPQANDTLRPPGGRSLSQSRQGVARPTPEQASLHHRCAGCDLGRVPLFPRRQTPAHRDGISPGRADGRSMFQPRLAIERANDPREIEAARTAEEVMSMPGLQAPQPRGSVAAIEAAPGGSSAVPRSVGQRLDRTVRNFMEPRFGFDFSVVRVHTDEAAGAAAAQLGARAFTARGDVFFSAGQYRPSTRSGLRLIAHELAHIASGHTAASPDTVYREGEPPARLPTEDQRKEVLKILDPHESAGHTPVVDNPAAFTSEIVAVGRTLREASIGPAQHVKDAPVVLSEPDLTDVGAIAEREVRSAVGSVLSPTADLTAVRNRLRYIPTDPGTAPAGGEATLTADELTGLDLSAVRIKLAQSSEALEIIAKHHVQPTGRDQELFVNASQKIVDEAPGKWRTIALTFRGWNLREKTLIQRRIAPMSGEATEQAHRRGRWLNLGTSIHEMLHAVTHPRFSRAIRNLEQSDLAIEGFTEFFTRPIYADIVSRSASDAALRLSIEGAPGPAFTPPPRTSYEDFFKTVNTEIFPQLDSNIENMRQAYFLGRVEYLGLGPWNELIHDFPTERANLIGGGVLLQSTGSGLQGRALVRASYGHLIWGHSGSVQVDLRAGAGLTYLTDGQRLGIGPEASATLRGGHLFLSGGALFEGNLAVGGAPSPRLDALLRIEAGAQIGRLHLGPGVEVLLPVTDRDAAGRGRRVFVGLGASFVFGK
jgi:Domain of unknown function (DUF4157)